MYYRIIFYMCEYCKSLPKANLGLCYRGFQKFFFQPVADLPTQPPVRHSNAETPLQASDVNFPGPGSVVYDKMALTTKQKQECQLARRHHPRNKD